ncbi:unnamed protein product [Ilex paraguariensis]|uniref:Uncharacterized protein n=1 Tax=Ilex paraguariensis TaxID=185542 RepID=A0ABC8UKK4_9AQUA
MGTAAADLGYARKWALVLGDTMQLLGDSLGMGDTLDTALEVGSSGVGSLISEMLDGDALGVGFTSDAFLASGGAHVAICNAVAAARIIFGKAGDNTLVALATSLVFRNRRGCARTSGDATEHGYGGALGTVGLEQGWVWRPRGAGDSLGMGDTLDTALEVGSSGVGSLISEMLDGDALGVGFTSDAFLASGGAHVAICNAVAAARIIFGKAGDNTLVALATSLVFR